MPTSYSWTLYEAPFSGSAPEPAAATGELLFGTDARKKQFERGIKFANVPEGRAEFVVHGGPRVYHVNSVSNIIQEQDKLGQRADSYSGVVKFRFRNYRNYPVPLSINQVETRSSDRWSNPRFSFTGKFEEGHLYYSLSTGSVSEISALPYRLSQTVAGRLANGNIIVAGGYTSNFSFGERLMASASLFNAASSSWSVLTSMPTKKGYHCGTILKNSGDFLVVGGNSVDSNLDQVEGRIAYRWISASSSWFTIPTLSSSKGATRNGRIVAFENGDAFLPTALSGTTNYCQVFSSSLNRFVDISASFDYREAYSINVFPDNSVIVAGGILLSGAATNSVKRFYFASGSSTFVSASDEQSMSKARMYHSSVVIGSDLYVFGGLDTASTYTNTCEVYNSISRTWSSFKSMNRTRGAHESISYISAGGNRRVTILGGIDSSGAVAETETFVFEDPLTGWVRDSDLLRGVFFTSAVQMSSSLTDPTKVLIICGSTGSTEFSSLSGSQLFTTTG